jgi:hypothetical protein
MVQLTGQTRGARPRKDHDAARWLTVATALVLLGSVRCTFPDYDINRATGGNGSMGTAGDLAVSGAGNGAVSGNGSAGSAGSDSGGSAGNAGTTSEPQGGNDGAVGGEGARGGEAGSGAVPACVGEQWPVERCADAGCAPRYPAHCYDGDLSADEVDVDCGGACQACSNEACQQNADCLSQRCDQATEGSACYASLTFSYLSHDTSPNVDNITWGMRLRNDEPFDGRTYVLQDLKIRYYIQRSGLVEPLRVQATQSNLIEPNGDTRTLSQTSWSIERVEVTPGAAYDAYVEVGFGDSGRLASGDRIELRQQLLTGLAGNSFDQHANYSFPTANDGDLHVSVFYQGRLMWGLEPRPANPRACFARAVNLNGPVVNIGGGEWLAASEASLVTTGSPATQNGTPNPPATGDLAAMLGTSTRLDAGESLDWPVDNATYLVYLYASSTDTSVSLFNVQGVKPDSSAGFHAITVGGQPVWARLGPFRVDVTTSTLNVAVTKGAISFAGIELWYPQ